MSRDIRLLRDLEESLEELEVAGNNSIPRRSACPLRRVEASRRDELHVVVRADDNLTLYEL